MLHQHCRRGNLAAATPHTLLRQHFSLVAIGYIIQSLQPIGPAVMLLRVLGEGDEEMIFNTDCQVALLLDSIKRAHNIPRTETIDLCTIDGMVKELYKQGKANAAKFFKMRELCLVVYIQNPENEPFYIPALKEYADNKCFEALLNTKEDKVSTPKNKYKQSQSGTPRGSGVALGRPLSATKNKTKRRYTHSQH